jgi:predicted small lipoprotein YifL
MSRTSYLLLFLLSAALSLSACGNKGPLVMPDKPQDQQGEKKDPPADPAKPAEKTGDATHPR